MGSDIALSFSIYLPLAPFRTSQSFSHGVGGKCCLLFFPAVFRHATAEGPSLDLSLAGKEGRTLHCTDSRHGNYTRWCDVVVVSMMHPPPPPPYHAMLLRFVVALSHLPSFRFVSLTHLRLGLPSQITRHAQQLLIINRSLGIPTWALSSPLSTTSCAAAASLSAAASLFSPFLPLLPSPRINHASK